MRINRVGLTDALLTSYKNRCTIVVACETPNLKTRSVSRSATFRRRVLRRSQPLTPSVALQISGRGRV
jgi:hypothetical protein